MGEDNGSRPRVPDDETIEEALLRHATAGDLSRVAQVLSGRGMMAYEPKRQQAIIRNCIRECARLGTPQLLYALFNEMLQFDAGLLLRAQTQVLYRMWRADDQARATLGELPAEAVEAIERVGRIEERIVYLSQAFIRAERSMMSCQRRSRGGGQVLRMTDYASADQDAPAAGDK
ncbi:MAG: hypothetical protein L6R28_22625 [Planctomycetes bacterium]|nr:hypothetical protein [Planctomycetota bacterium]